jgi:ribonuclease HII
MSLKSYDDFLRTSYGEYIAGIDECGRGSCAGGIVSACVLMNSLVDIPGVNDSKKLSEKKRDELYEQIKKHAISIQVAVRDQHFIDQHGINKANKEIIEEVALKTSFGHKVDLFVIDQASNIQIKNMHMLPKADSTSFVVACASIVAKVIQCQLIKELDEKYPEYKLISNKGYLTKDHIQAIKENGLSEIHRKSYSYKFL